MLEKAMVVMDATVESLGIITPEFHALLFCDPAAQPPLARERPNHRRALR
jgi:hypothetical protein